MSLIIKGFMEIAWDKVKVESNNDVINLHFKIMKLTLVFRKKN